MQRFKPDITVNQAEHRNSLNSKHLEISPSLFFFKLCFVFRTKVLHLGFIHAACNWMRAGANWESQINKGIVGKAELTVCCYCSKNAGLFVCYSYFPQAAFPQPEQNKQTRPGSSSAEPRQGHMTSGGSELCHLRLHSAAACRVASISGVCQRFRDSVQKPSAAVTGASKLPNANSSSSKNSTAASLQSALKRLNTDCLCPN